MSTAESAKRSLTDPEHTTVSSIAKLCLMPSIDEAEMPGKEKGKERPKEKRVIIVINRKSFVIKKESRKPGSSQYAGRYQAIVG